MRHINRRAEYPISYVSLVSICYDIFEGQGCCLAPATSLAVMHDVCTACAVYWLDEAPKVLVDFRVSQPGCAGSIAGLYTFYQRSLADISQHAAHVLW